ncbi:hypothetical protein [Kitasatospora sp. NPDC050543]|uniref:hypothetical protein n=1 Tax=Kitasatospora sp. NPDC050543 TaxID=3364054 RepID=UPI0037AEDB1D
MAYPYASLRVRTVPNREGSNVIVNIPLVRTIKSLATSAVMALAIVTPTSAAHAATPHSCPWTQEGASGAVRVQGMPIGYVDQEFDYCGHSRAVFRWDTWFRTNGHPGITGAWVTAVDQGLWTQTTVQNGPVGSLDSSSVSTKPVGVHTNGEDSWIGEAKVRITFTNRGPIDCWGYSGTWNYHDGQQEGARSTATADHRSRSAPHDDSRGADLCSTTVVKPTRELVAVRTVGSVWARWSGCRPMGVERIDGACGLDSGGRAGGRRCGDLADAALPRGMAVYLQRGLRRAGA